MFHGDRIKAEHGPINGDLTGRMAGIIDNYDLFVAGQEVRFVLAPGIGVRNVNRSGNMMFGKMFIRAHIDKVIGGVTLDDRFFVYFLGIDPQRAILFQIFFAILQEDDKGRSGQSLRGSIRLRRRRRLGYGNGAASGKR